MNQSKFASFIHLRSSKQRTHVSTPTNTKLFTVCLHYCILRSSASSRLVSNTRGTQSGELITLRLLYASDFVAQFLRRTKHAVDHNATMNIVQDATRRAPKIKLLINLAGLSSDFLSQENYAKTSHLVVGLATDERQVLSTSLLWLFLLMRVISLLYFWEYWQKIFCLSWCILSDGLWWFAILSRTVRCLSHCSIFILLIYLLRSCYVLM